MKLAKSGLVICYVIVILKIIKSLYSLMQSILDKYDRAVLLAIFIFWSFEFYIIFLRDCVQAARSFIKPE
jgi:hypothetical protein